MRKLPTLVMLLSLALLPQRSFAGEATAQLSATINEFVAIMVRTSVAELRSTGLPEKALKLIHGRFDFAEMTKRSLGSHWKTLAPAEQGEFIDGLTHRLLVTYGRTVRASGDEKVLFKKETRDGSYANVESLVVGGKSDTAIDYRLHEVNGQWRVYDMVIEHVSLISNFRAQFEREIARSSVQGLLEKIKQRDS
ncbi:MAG: ABC transporter substrate-binding protein [Deltaproteobacteria bacterium]|nr:ABC transporter substrate-binding protein [Deltaproteobacteria bacterium]